MLTIGQHEVAVLTINFVDAESTAIIYLADAVEYLVGLRPDSLLLILRHRKALGRTALWYLRLQIR